MSKINFDHIAIINCEVTGVGINTEGEYFANLDLFGKSGAKVSTTIPVPKHMYDKCLRGFAKDGHYTAQLRLS